MTNQDQDIFGKIDAMLEKRDADVLTAKGIDSDDFPMLTEVIDEGAFVAWKGPDRRSGSQTSDGRRLTDQRIGPCRQSDQIDSNSPILNEEVEHLLVAMELRLTELLRRQQLWMEEALRKMIQDVLGRDEGSKS